MDIIDKLTEVFKEFPGIGERQAKRFVYFLMSKNPAYSENLAELIKDLKKETTQCKECFRFFILNSKKENSCNNCSSLSTDSSTLMIVEKDSDLESIKKSGVYSGKYFILGGLVPIVEKTTKSRVRIEELKNKVLSNKNIKEIILAFSISPQGNHTDQYVREQLKDITEKLNIKISSLGRGLSTGTELEYSDNDTLKNALKNRQ
ncbi:MAG: toprim domain-containing protein [Candidatus Pacebacteria bacterium]|nr:toprim domain-containing protein [Candidatus Paceibacterota bacterium]